MFEMQLCLRGADGSRQCKSAQLRVVQILEAGVI